MATVPSKSVAQRAPRKRRRPVRSLLVCLLLIGALVAIHRIWTSYERRQLNREVADLRRRGEPVLPDDLKEATTADGDNAAIDLRAGGDAIDESTVEFANFTRIQWYLPLPADELQVANQVIETNRQSLSAIVRARTKTGADWHVEFRSPLLLQALPHVGAQRRLALLVRASAIVDHQVGGDHHAIERLDDLLFISGAMDAPRTRVTHLVASAMSEMCTGAVEQMAPDLKLEPMTGGSDAKTATRQQVRALIAKLLDDAPLREGYHRALQGERAAQLDGALAICRGEFDGPGKPTAHGWTVEPLALSDARWMLGHMAQVMDAVAQPDLLSCRARMPSTHDLDGHGVRHCVALIYSHAESPFCERQYRVIADRRLAATALAIRCFAVDHNNALPPALGALVPVYLPAVPLDPFTTGQPIRYTADEKNPIIYSVGMDERDDGGSDRDDAVFHLSRQPRPPEVEGDGVDAPPAPPR